MTRTRARTILAALSLSGGMLLVAAAPASAADHPPFTPPAPPDPLTDTGWQPAENREPSAPINACSTRIVLDEVDRFFSVEERVRTYRGGVTRIDGRGQAIIKATAADGRAARLDASGPYTIIINKRSGVTDLYFRGATVVLPGSALEARALTEAGIPRFSAYSGNTHFREVADPDTGKTVRVEVVSRPRFVTNACQLLVR